MNNSTHVDKRFSRQERLRKRKEFDKVFEEGRAFRKGSLHAYVLSNSLAYSRLGIVLSKKLGHAVRRNRIRRLLRECYRLNKALLGPGLDVILLPTPGLPDTFQGMEEEFKRLVQRIKG